MLMTEDEPATETSDLDEGTLRTLREHAAWVEHVTETTLAVGGRLLSRGELDSWAGALRALLGEVDRLKGAAPTDEGPRPAARSGPRRHASSGRAASAPPASTVTAR